MTARFTGGRHGPRGQAAGWHRYGHTVAALAVMAVTVGVIAVTANQLDNNPSSPAAGPQRSPAPTPSASAALSPTDVAFIELMIPMIEQALPLLDLLSTDPEATLRDVATALATTYPAEVTKLREALAAGGVAEQNPHAGMDMPGFVTQAQLAAVGYGSGSSRNAAARDVLCSHLRQSLLVARAELNAGSDVATRAVATAMVTSRGEHLTALGCGQPPSP
jgi:uncharacterized protein (DUF305 family)